MMRSVAYLASTRDMRHVVTDLLSIRKADADDLLLCYSEQDLATNRDLMREIVTLAHYCGLTVTAAPWGVAGVFGGEAISSFVARQPSAAQVRANRQATDTACPANPLTQAFVASWLQAVVAAGCDGVLWDEPHYRLVTEPREKRWTCACTPCRNAFRRHYGRLMPASWCSELQQLHDAQLLGLLQPLLTEAHNAGLRNTLCLNPEYPDLADWPVVLGALPHLDQLAIDPYLDLSSIRAAVTQAAESAAAHDLPLQLWLKASAVTAGTESGQLEAAQIGLANGVASLGIWSFYGGEGVGQLRSTNPDSVWEYSRQVLALARQEP